MLRIGQVEPTAQNNLYTDGNVASGIAATRLRAAAFNAIQEELAYIIENSGGTLSTTDTTQILTTLKALFQAKDAGLASLAALAGGANMLPYYTAADVFAQTALTATGRSLIGQSSIANVLTYLGLGGGLTGVVGQSVNAAMTVAAASASATWTADELIVETALGGTQYRLNSLNLSVNLASVGAGAMDTGTAPVSGYVALYVIYNPTSGAKALLATNATSAKAGEVYGGANMPSGYTASALVCVVPTDSTGKIVPLLQMGRKTLIATAQLGSTTAFISTPTALNISAAVPKNAKFLDGILYLVSGNSTRPVIAVQPLATPAVGMKQLVGGNSSGVNNTQAPFSDLVISTAQTIYWQVYAGVAGDTISSAFTYATAYSI